MGLSSWGAQILASMFLQFNVQSWFLKGGFDALNAAVGLQLQRWFAENGAVLSAPRIRYMSRRGGARPRERISQARLQQVPPPNPTMHDFYEDDAGECDGAGSGYIQVAPELRSAEGEIPELQKSSATSAVALLRETGL